MDIQNYLDRIKYQGNVAPQLSVLQQLQELHLYNVPFENLDIHYGRPIGLDIDQFYQKIVRKKRGGFCYELNGLFERLLSGLGFSTKIISARVYDDKKKTYGAEFDHLAIIVDLDQVEYLVDVGFGAFSFQPLVLRKTTVQKDPGGQFIIERAKEDYIISSLSGDKKTIEYRFSDNARSLPEFQGMCTFHQTSPASHFTQKRLISKPLPNAGRVTLAGNTLKITAAGQARQTLEFPAEDYSRYLLEWFGLKELDVKAGS